MLIPAILRKDEIVEGFKKYFYSKEMIYITGCLENWCPEIVENNTGGTYQYAIVNNDGELTGYIGFEVDWYASCAYNFGFISFNPGNYNNGEAVFEVIEMILDEWKLHRVEWRVISGNPVERSYDVFCAKCHGNRHELKDVFRDRYGKFHNSIIYEIINTKLRIN